MARQTAAKALRLLESEGLVTRIPGLGYYVTESPGKVRSDPARACDPPVPAVHQRDSRWGGPAGYGSALASRVFTTDRVIASD